MPRYPLDVCWITQTPSPSFSDDLSTIRELSQTAPLNFGLAIVGDVPLASLSEFEAPNLELVSLQHSQSPGSPLTLSEDDVSAFASLLERLQVTLGPEDEGELLVELAHLLMHLGPGFRPGALLRHPTVIQQMMEIHAHRGLGHTVTDTILIVNELLEIFQRTTNMVGQIPEARLYHAVRGSYVGLIAALATERFQSKLIFSDSLDPGDDLAPFWLNALPHHWHSSLANSPLYHALGERILMLTREILFRHSVSFLTPFPNQTDQDASHVQVVGPGLMAPEERVRASNDGTPLHIGWLMPTITLGMLETLDHVLTHIADLAGNWKIRLIEAAPHRRDWVCDLDAWLLEHPVAAQCFEEAVAYHPAELDKIDLLVALPGTASANQDVDTGSEEASWIALQALASSIPLLATQTLCEWFWDKEAPGIFVRDGHDAKEAAAGLRKLAEQPNERTRFAQAAKRIASSQFSRDNVVKTLATLYTESLADRVHHRPVGISHRSTASNWGATNP